MVIASPAFVTWIEITASERDKVRRTLDVSNEQGTGDERLLGGIRHFLSDALFPGIYVLHTRLRYVLLILSAVESTVLSQLCSASFFEASNSAFHGNNASSL